MVSIGATLLKADGSEAGVVPENKPFFELEEMQKLVGGYIEHLHTLPDGRYVIGDEEGELKKRPVNVAASKLVGFQLLGDILIVPESMMERDDD